MSSWQSIGMSDISKYFCLPEKDTAKQLGICLTSLKKICRQNGITRWPYRKIMSANKKLQKAVDTISPPTSMRETLSTSVSSCRAAPDDDAWSSCSSRVHSSEGSDGSIISSPCEEDQALFPVVFDVSGFTSDIAMSREEELERQSHLVLEQLADESSWCPPDLRERPGRGDDAPPAPPPSAPLPFSFATCLEMHPAVAAAAVSSPRAQRWAAPAPAPAADAPACFHTFADSEPAGAAAAGAAAAELSDQDLIALLASCAGGGGSAAAAPAPAWPPAPAAEAGLALADAAGDGQLSSATTPAAGGGAGADDGDGGFPCGALSFLDELDSDGGAPDAAPAHGGEEPAAV